VERVGFESSTSRLGKVPVNKTLRHFATPLRGATVAVAAVVLSLSGVGAASAHVKEFGPNRVKEFGPSRVKEFGPSRVKEFGPSRVKEFGPSRVKEFGPSRVKEF